MRIIFIVIAITILFQVNAYAESDMAFRIIKEHLMSEKEWDLESVQSLLIDFKLNGYDISFDIHEDELYKYDISLNVLEEVWGDYYDWSINEKHRFDQLMVDCGELSYCHNLIPSDKEMPQEEAENLAFEEVKRRCKLDSISTCLENIHTSYYITSESDRKGKWRISIEMKDGRAFEIEIKDGVINMYKENIKTDNLENEYNLLCEERGAFFKWNLEQKMEFADSLHLKLKKAKENNTLIMSDLELEAIRNYGFCLPTADSISIDNAYMVASNEAEKHLNINRITCREIYYSFFYNKEIGYVWRVIFWNIDDLKYTSVIVDMKAESGIIISIKSNGNKSDEYVPYIERL